MRVAIVHDWLVGGGAERVVEELHKLYPDAPIYTSYCTPEWRKRLDDKVVTGWLQHFGKVRKFIPVLRIWWFTHLDFSDYDLVISSSGNGEAFGIRVHKQKGGWLSKLLVAHGASEDRKGGVQNSTLTDMVSFSPASGLSPLHREKATISDRSSQQSDTSKSGGRAVGFADSRPSAVREPVHVNYCHAPTHFYWRFYDQYLNEPGFGIFNPLARIGLKLLTKPLRAWDYEASQRPDYFIANSTHIQSEIKQFYGRESIVIYPPVDIERFSNTHTEKRSGFVTASRQVPQKKLDIIIGACNELKLPLTVIGRGPEHNKLVAMAGDTIKFRDDVSDEEMPKLLASAEAFLFAAYEDFGVTPVEALATGTPVIAYKKGGALDYVKPGINGDFFEQQTSASLSEALQKFDAKRYSETAIKKSANCFNSDSFRNTFKNYVGNKMKEKI